MRALIIVALIIPILAIPSLFIGFELPLYLAMGLIGMVLWLYSEDPALNFAGTQIMRVGFVLFIVAFIYYFFSGNLVGTTPFEFTFLKAMVNFTIEFYVRISNLIGNIILGNATIGEPVNNTTGVVS